MKSNAPSLLWALIRGESGLFVAAAEPYLCTNNGESWLCVHSTVAIIQVFSSYIIRIPNTCGCMTMQSVAIASTSSTPKSTETSYIYTMGEPRSENKVLSQYPNPRPDPLRQILESLRRKGPRMNGVHRIWGGHGTGPCKYFPVGRSTRPSCCEQYARESENRTMVVSLPVSISLRDLSLIEWQIGILGIAC